MPLIKCPECGRMVSDLAAECPNCGCPVGQITAPSPKRDISTGVPQRKVTNKELYGVIGILSLFLLALVVSILLSHNGSEKDIAQDTPSVSASTLGQITDKAKSADDVKKERIEDEDVEGYEDNGLFEDKEINVTNGCTIKMIAVYGGSFLMGGTSEQGGDTYANELPAHRVTLDNYYIGQTEVTQALWKAVMGYNPSAINHGDLYPVESINYNDCQAFVNKLNQLTKGKRPKGKVFRIPTEAEWEYAARGGQSGGFKYSGSDAVGLVAWYNSNANGKTHHVKSLNPNALGVFDMSGNVSEWTSDWFDANYYERSEQYNPCNKVRSQQMAGRGGSFVSQPRNCRVSDRHYYSPKERSGHLGLRLAL